MKIQFLRLENFLSYAGVHEIDLTEISTCVIVGDNGVGKSSILEGVLYALFGQSRAGSEDELSHGYDSQTKAWAVNSFSVNLTFEMNGKQYTVTRQRSSKKATLTFTNDTDKKNYTANGIRETQDVIHKIIGMEYDSFVSSVMLRQNDYDEFMKMTPAEAKEVLLEILGLDSFESKRQLAADRANKANSDAQRFTEEIERIVAEQKTADGVPERIRSNESQLADLKHQLEETDTLMEEAQREHAKMKAACDGVHQALIRLDQLNRERPQASAMKRSAENDFERNLSKLGISASALSSMHIDDVRRDLEAVKAKGQVEEGLKNRLSTAVSEALGKLTFLRSKVSEVDARKKAGASTSMCLLGKPECHAELMNRIDVELEQVIGQGKAARQAHEEAEAALKAQVERVENLSKEAYRLSDVMVALTSMMNAQARSVALDNIDKEIAVLTLQVRDNANTLEDVRAKELEISGLKMRRERLQGHVDGLLQELGKLNEVLSRVEKLKKTASELSGSLTVARRDEAVYSLLAKAFSKEGIPALMIENIIPVLESDANAMLERLSDGRIRLQFLLQRKLKGGGMAESFEIYVTDENGTRSVQMYSGGEKYRIIFAVHSAFSKYLTYRGGSRIGFLAIDEPAGLDEAGISRLVETLSVLKEHYEQIFVITHLKELMEYFPQTIVVEKSGGSSKVTTKAKKTFSEGIL